MDIKVTELERKDYDKLADILYKQQLYHYNLNKNEDFLDVDIEVFKDYMLKTNNLVLVAEDEDAKDLGYIGFLAVSSRSIKEALVLQDIYVEETYRGNMIGTLLMQDALCWSEDTGFDKILVHVTKGNERVLDFYERFGFKPNKQDNNGYELVRK